MSQVSKVLSVAKGEVGYRAERAPGERPSGHQKYSPQVPGLEWSQYQPWCATWVSWVAMKAGVANLFPRTASVWTAMSWFKQRGRWSAYPAVGAQVIYGASGSTHTGICYAYDETYIYTYEGNTSTTNDANGNGVMKRQRRRRDAYVHGYGLPSYAEGIVTADPSKKGRAGFTYRAAASGPVTGTTPTKPSRGKQVIVKAGQSLATIAAAAGVSLATVIGLNPQIKNPNVIHPGDKVTVPDKTPAKPAPKPQPKVPSFPGAAKFKPGQVNEHVTQLGEALVRKGYGRFYAIGPGPRWTNADRNAVRAFQRAQGWSGSSADGYPGPVTWARLMK
ncbi:MULTISPECIES: peptidoglycan-binding protein [Streptomyces]|uniref:peptidoglycan-binding protein n=1 Tax=Streptomyces TaxID=1883 RepID=UPI001E4A7E96|nr:peptidoglycan-binding protein [Streptomyces huasconensis]UFQ16425.1 peptidoglycan-binding protein [Streptomyces huasconensis]